MRTYTYTSQHNLSSIRHRPHIFFLNLMHIPWNHSNCFTIHLIYAFGNLKIVGHLTTIINLITTAMNAHQVSTILRGSFSFFCDFIGVGMIFRFVLIEVICLLSTFLSKRVHFQCKSNRHKYKRYSKDFSTFPSVTFSQLHINECIFKRNWDSASCSSQTGKIPSYQTNEKPFHNDPLEWTHSPTVVRLIYLVMFLYHW